ncbi:hypothetical protein QYE76_023636 [Lolium multiflorum]|uniref:Reverse transcriptase domain-containing protein n=1 Tax=Lolium multiflorum TaxID=4521 RepID=A0AAD8RET5_LOLMU|nr:hypothetical protein QYE76_023636 [Lolium multiflorum]
MKAEVLEEVKKEIKKMLDAGFIRPCRYAEWISNVVPVEKKDGRWRVAIDFRNLNSATPKDEYPMPVAETLINAAAGHKILSFMDGNAGYNQIFMAPEDIHKTAFRVPGSVGLFEYVVMTFGLKNAGATYQRAMNYIFHDLIGKLVEIYIDDVVVKSVATDGHLEDLRRVLDRTRKFGLRMNPKKCAFGVTAGQFLGFLVHERGIEIGLKSQEAVRTMKPPTTKKELQCLIGKINFVRRFISNLSGRIEPFMGLVKIKPDEEFRWGAEQQHVFDDMIRLQPPTKSSHATMSSSSSELSYGSSSSRETPPDIRAPEEWDLADHASSIWSEDDQSLTSGDENLQLLVDEELEPESEDDLWEGCPTSEEEEEIDDDDDSLEGYPPAKRLRMWWDDDSSDDEDGDEAPVEGYGSSDEEPIGSSADEGSEDDDEGSDGP